ncbi:hypothetical protein IQ254_18385 [Nodosilinea sp. LEGE 07088]|uniref:hypothetical protein n=1 Tax=Nodosilinea sp. LEGE 07088 TaxID=2777968 RepID=UPI00187FC3C6|nr:hypothetical protein [Nodosilinea sp. LEGE 07088]MBE9139139.1 hypothetical protein [Nodosilinea sp. LEGE 07088]
MASTSWYWTLILLKASGGYRSQAFPSNQLFFQQQFADLLGCDSLESEVDKRIQRRLMALLTDNSAGLETRLLAEYCLRCYISHQILYACIDLQTKFGQEHGFSRDDVLRIVLNDVDLTRSLLVSVESGYRPFAADIITTFKPQVGSLSAWARMLTRQHNDLNNFLLEHGILQQSNWALLNEKTPDDLQRIFSDTFNLPASEIEQACKLLSGYHAVYRRDRRGRRGKCQPPTETQINEIQRRAALPVSAAAVIEKLVEIADYLRRYQLLSKGVLPSISMDDPAHGSGVEPATSSDDNASDSESDEIIQLLYELVNECLEQAIRTVIDQRYHYLKERASPKAEQYRLALKLYYCEHRTMAEMVPELNLDAQFQVTRLLKVDDFLANIRRQLLRQLKDRFSGLSHRKELFHDYRCADRLQNLDENHLAPLIKKPRANASGNSTSNSFFLQCLCNVIQQL